MLIYAQILIHVYIYKTKNGHFQVVNSKLRFRISDGVGNSYL